MNFKLIKEQAKTSLQGNRLMLLLALIIVSAITSTGIGGIIAPVLSAGIFLICKKILKERKFDFNLIFDCFKDLNHAIKLIGASLLYALIVFGGLLLFVIPGIIFAFRYSQVIPVLTENKDMTITEGLRRSSELMKGYKFDFFLFNLSFIGHFILGIITLGIYFLYFIPYYQNANTNYYLHLTKQN